MTFKNLIFILALISIAVPAFSVPQQKPDKKKGGIVIEPGKEPDKNTPKKSTKKRPPPKPLPPPLPPLATYQFNTVMVDADGNVIDRRSGEATYFIEDLGEGVFIEMVQIPAGSFIMGSPDSEEDRFFDEGPQREVTVPAFYMSKYEVTQSQWRAIASSSRRLTEDPSNFKGDDLPVEQVSWEDAERFCDELSRKTRREYRLPSEAEWEYACRAGMATPFHFGQAITPEFVNYKGDSLLRPASNGPSNKGTRSVGNMQVANGFGLYDMHGNVSEWCEDVWHKDYEGAPADGSAWYKGGDKNYRVMRGGSWSLNGIRCRSATRFKSLPGEGLPDVGFRVVLALN